MNFGRLTGQLKAENEINQQVGVSGAFLSEIKPQADGANGTKYNLTQDIIESIFKTYPAVKRKHFDHVPSKMSEQEFWSKFFQSHYFHRDRIHHKGIKDLFTECAKDDDKQIKARLNTGVDDATANIGRFNDSTLDEHYGINEAPPDKKDVNIVHYNIIKRFNHHSIMVMSINDEEGKCSDCKKRLVEKTNYDDLTEEPPKKIAKLNLAKTERYLNGPTTISNSSSYLTTDEIVRSRNALLTHLSSWRVGKCDQALSSAKSFENVDGFDSGWSVDERSPSTSHRGNVPRKNSAGYETIVPIFERTVASFLGVFPSDDSSIARKSREDDGYVEKI